MADGRGNLSSFVYDRFDRLSELHFPVATASAGSASATDFLGWTYDAASRVTQERRRNGTTIAYGYDAMDRLVSGYNGASTTTTCWIA